jgi:two-component system sensor histidine kinase KdpD
VLSPRSNLAGIAAAVGGTSALVAALAPLDNSIGLLNVALLFLLLTVLISAYWGLRVGLFAAALTNLAFNFFFVEPLHGFAVQEPSNIIGLMVFLVVSVVSGSLLSHARNSAMDAALRETETLALLKLSRAMIGQQSPEDALHAVCREVVAAFDAPGVSVLAPGGSCWAVRASAGSPQASRETDAEERALAEQAATTGDIVRAGATGLGPRRTRVAGRARMLLTRASANRAIAFVPLQVRGGSLGVLRIDGPVGHTPFSATPDRMLEAFAGEAALALERVDLAIAASQAEALRKTNELRSALMTSISHDLKTPLAGIKAAVSSLLDGNVAWSNEDRLAFLETIESQADRLNRTISDILDLNRVEAGSVRAMREPILVADLLEDARARAASLTNGRSITTQVEENLYVVSDESLVSHALVNLLENAAKYSTPGRDIRLLARADGESVKISVEDDGPGIADDDLPHVFERFYRGRDNARVKGSGLGLAIVQSFISLCGGAVRAESSPAGTRFVITLPMAS